MGATQIPGRQVKDASINTSDLTDASVTAAKLAALAATFSKIQIGATNPCLEDDGAGGIQVKTGSGMQRTSSGITPALLSTGGLVNSAVAPGDTTSGLWLRGARVKTTNPYAGTQTGGDFWYDSTNDCFQDHLGSGFMGRTHCYAVDSAGSTAVTNTTAESNCDQLVNIPANTLKVGRVLRARWMGRYTAVAGSTMTIRGYLGTTPIADPGASDPPDVAGTSRGWFAELWLFCTNVGVSGGVRGHLMHGYHQLSGGLIGIPVNTASVTINTTAALDWKLSFQWSAANAGNTIFSQLATWEILTP